jgi:putative membrane protein
MEWIINLLVTGFAIWLAALILPGVSVRGFGAALWVAILLAIINATLGWLLRFITTPLNWLTLGLVHFIINVLMILLVDKLVSRFHIRNFWWAVIFAILISIITNIINWIF